jgi:hypothetical protein
MWLTRYDDEVLDGGSDARGRSLAAHQGRDLVARRGALVRCDWARAERGLRTSRGCTLNDQLAHDLTRRSRE